MKARRIFFPIISIFAVQLLSSCASGVSYVDQDLSPSDQGDRARIVLIRESGFAGSGSNMLLVDTGAGAIPNASIARSDNPKSGRGSKGNIYEAIYYLGGRIGSSGNTEAEITFNALLARISGPESVSWGNKYEVKTGEFIRVQHETRRGDLGYIVSDSSAICGFSAIGEMTDISALDEFFSTFKHATKGNFAYLCPDKPGKYSVYSPGPRSAGYRGPFYVIARISNKTVTLFLDLLKRNYVYENASVVGEIANNSSISWHRPAGTLKLLVLPCNFSCKSSGATQTMMQLTSNLASGKTYYIKISSMTDAIISDKPF